MNLVKLGATVLRIYAMHLLVFTAGTICGAILGLTISQAAFVAMLKMKGLL